MCKVLLQIMSEPGAFSLVPQATGLLFGSSLKDGAYFCYCAYVPRISRYSGFLSVVPTNTGIFLRGLKLYGKIGT